MSALQAYVLFVLPVAICLAAGIGILVLKRSKSAPAKRPVEVETDLTNVVPLRAANE